MPASITIALVASRPKVSGSRIEMPASGPMPGSMPTSVPTRHPRNANHSTSGRNATEKPSSRLSKDRVHEDHSQNRPRSSGAFKRFAEQPVGEQRRARCCRPRHAARLRALDHDQQHEHQQRHGDEKAEPLVAAQIASRGDQRPPARVPAVAPVDAGERRAAGAENDQHRGACHHQGRSELRHHAGAGRGKRAEREIAAQREHGDAERR